MFILYLLLIGLIYGADYKNCKLKDGRFECLKKFNDIRDSVLTLNLQKDENIDKVIKICKDYRKCAEDMKCQARDQIIEYIDKLLMVCDVMDFRQNPRFKECSDKLVAKKSQCLNEWNPFPEKVDDPKKMEEIQREACKNFFGKDNCIEKETTEACGLEMWKLQKKHFLDMNKAIGKCKLN